jgi:hypothetical protein
LPLTLLSSICFRTAEDQRAFEMAAEDVSNVDVIGHRIVVEESLFSNVTDAVWPPAQASKPQQQNSRKNTLNSQQGDLLGMSEDALQISDGIKNCSLVFAQALGGLLAMLYHNANRSELGVSAFRLITGAAGEPNAILSHDPILAEFPNWLDGRGISEHADIPARLYWGVMDSLVVAQENNRPSQPIEIVVDYLDSQRIQLTEKKTRLRLERLIADMRGCLGLGGGTITELFERNKGSLSRPLLLFCLRPHCLDLLEFSHPLLSEAEYLLASILFGVRDGWLQLPRPLRNPALANYVMCYMASIAHQKQGDVLTFPERPSPQPLRVFFSLNTDTWNENQTAASIEIAQSSKWQDCIETIIASIDGFPLDDPKQKNGQFIFSGAVTLTMEIKREIFLQHLGQWPPINAQLESRVKTMLGETCG